MQTAPQVGWIVLIGAIGMMAGLMAVDVAKLKDWHEAQSTAFVAAVMAHFASVVLAFVGGKLLPADPMPGGRRGSDPKE